MSWYRDNAVRRYWVNDPPMEPPPDRLFHYCARCGCEVYEDEDLCDECREEEDG